VVDLLDEEADCAIRLTALGGEEPGLLEQDLRASSRSNCEAMIAEYAGYGQAGSHGSDCTRTIHQAGGPAKIPV